MPSPIVTATFQAGLLSAISNVLAQLITCQRAGASYTLNISQLLQFVTYSVLSCPPNYIWQAFLEAQFPGRAKELSPTEKELIVDEVVTGTGTGAEINDANGDLSKRHVEEKTMAEKSEDATTTTGPLSESKKTKKLNLKNTAIKFSLDQTLGSAINTVLFITGIALLRGQPVSSLSKKVQEQFWPMIFAGQKLWPAVSILSFTVIPLQHRMLFGSVAGLFWGVYLSLMAGSGKT